MRAQTRPGTIPPNETHGALATGSEAENAAIGGSVSAPGPVLIMAGGTGGHVFPALAVAHVLRDRGVAVVWLGVPGSMESRLVPANGFPIEWVRVAGIRGKGLKTWLLAPVTVIKAVAQTMGVLRRVQPRSVLGAGGYVSGPGGIAAWLLRVPLLIHEQNAVAGMTNRWLARLATQVLAAFPGSFEPRVHARVIGNPVRADIAALAAPPARFAGRETRSRLLVFGGSQGAMRLNSVVPQALARVAPEIRPQVRHQTGERGLEAARAAYADARVEAEVLPFIDDMAEALSWADFAVCRAGAMTIAELQAAGLGAIFVPLAVATDDHQTKNAEVMVRSGAARVIQERDLTPERLGEAISELVADRPRLLKMAEAARGSRVIDAAARLADFCIAAGAHA
jgi:UDP-N-acetylglucosamine--N-acetylmuramyl-(pentapeptide) pyrophosphoryl-undecaprenol N-acetylglucosamine transferase